MSEPYTSTFNVEFVFTARTHICTYISPYITASASSSAGHS